MSTLNLTPSWELVAAHGAFFFTGVWMVKKLYVQPYLKQFEAREKATHGRSHTSGKLLTAVAEKKNYIEGRLAEAEREAELMRNQLRSDGLRRQADLIEGARRVAKQRLEKAEHALEAELGRERAHIAVVIAHLINQGQQVLTGRHTTEGVRGA